MIKYENMDGILKMQNYMEPKLKFLLYSLTPNPLPSPAVAIKEQSTIWKKNQQLGLHLHRHFTTDNKVS